MAGEVGGGGLEREKRKGIGNTGRMDNLINNTEEWKFMSYFEKREQSNVTGVQVYITPNITSG